jgi:hypothetical protein
MDHPTTLTREYGWRTTALVAGAFAAFELLFIVVVGLALLAKPFTQTENAALPAKKSEVAKAVEATPAATPAPAKTAPAPPAAPAGPKLERNETSVLVLNGNGSSGAAAEKADLVQTRGYLIAATGNAPHTDFERSVVMFRPGYRPEAERLGKDFGVRNVTPLDGLRASDLQGAHVVLIVGDV